MYKSMFPLEIPLEIYILKFIYSCFNILRRKFGEFLIRWIKNGGKFISILLISSCVIKFLI